MPRPRKEPPSMPLPGFEEAIAEQRESAAELSAEELTDRLLTPIASISRKTGDIERDSPLFKGTGASGQDEFFK